MEDKSISQLQMCNIGDNVDYRGMAAIYSLYEMSGLFFFLEKCPVVKGLFFQTRDLRT